MKRSNKSTVYSRMLITSLMIISASVFLIANTLYITGSNFIKQKSKDISATSLTVVADSVEHDFDNVNNLMLSIINEPILKENFSELPPRQKIRFNDQIFNKYYRDNVISDIYLYYTDTKTVVCHGYASTADNILNGTEWISYIDTLPDTPLNNKIYYSGNLATRILPFPYNSNNPLGYLVVNINLDRLFKAYSHQDDLYCITDNNNILAYGDERVYQIISKKTEEQIPLSEFFDKPVNIDGKDYIFSVYTKSGNNFMHIKGTPVSTLYSELDFLRNISIALSLLILAVAFFVYKKQISILYKPINSLIRTYGRNHNNTSAGDEFEIISDMFESVVLEKENLEKIYEKSKKALLQNVLINLYEDPSDDELYIINMLDSIGFPSKGRDYTVAIASLHETPDKKIPRDPIFDIRIPEVTILTVCLYDNKMVFLINTPPYYGKITEIVGYVQDFLSDHYKISCTIGVGNTYDALSEYRLSFREALSALVYTTASQSIMHITECITFDKNSSFYFTYDLENRLTESIKRANIDDALAIFEDICSTMASPEYSPAFCHSHLWQITNILVRTFSAMGYEYTDIYNTSVSDDFIKYSALTDKKQIFEYIKTKITTAVDYIANTQQHKSELIVQKIKDYISTHYAEDLSLDVLSGITNLSYPYLSSIFKQETGHTIIKYTTDVRMEKATELLQNTEMNVNDVAAAVGYNNVRTFLRNFQTFCGLTPTEYRKQYHE